jgi:hypothetical protein
MIVMLSFMSKFMTCLLCLYIELLPPRYYSNVTGMLQIGYNSALCSKDCSLFGEPEEKKVAGNADQAIGLLNSGPDGIPALFPSQGFCQEQGAVVVIVAGTVAGAPCSVDGDRGERRRADVCCRIVIRADIRRRRIEYVIQAACVENHRFHFRPHFLWILFLILL